MYKRARKNARIQIK